MQKVHGDIRVTQIVPHNLRACHLRPEYGRNAWRGTCDDALRQVSLDG